MLQKDGNFTEVKGNPVCLIWYAKTPDPKLDRTKDVVFRADIAFLCLRCHSLMPRSMLDVNASRNLKKRSSLLPSIALHTSKSDVLRVLTKRFVDSLSDREWKFHLRHSNAVGLL